MQKKKKRKKAIHIPTGLKLIYNGDMESSYQINFKITEIFIQ